MTQSSCVAREEKLQKRKACKATGLDCGLEYAHPAACELSQVQTLAEAGPGLVRV